MLCTKKDIMKLEQALKMDKFDSQQDKALLNVMYTGAWLTANFNQVLKPFDLSDQQYNVLRILRGQKGKAINLGDIQERMLHKMSNATRLVEKLKQKGLVERVRCENNRRKVEISITPAGKQLLIDVDSLVKSNEQAFMSKLSNEQAKQLSELLELIRE